MSNIPSDEELERAEKLSMACWRNLNEVNDHVEQYLVSRYPLDYLHIAPEGDDYFRAQIFFKQEQDLKNCMAEGDLLETMDEVLLFFKTQLEGVPTKEVSQAVHDIIDFVYAELERADRGKRGDIRVAFELDSYENVKANPHYHGDYFLRLR